MCGICGTFSPGGLQDHEENAAAIVQLMAERMNHRGPDDNGLWVDASAGVALAHRRLAIIDLSKHGAQPMLSCCGRFVCVYNGEIYNHGELRRTLNSHGYTFRGHSDTEVLLAAVAEWGAVDTISRLNGMFAFAIWDRHEQSLLLARDRMGEKPLYYSWIGGTLVFASELKAIQVHPAFQPRIDRAALAMYMQRGYVPAPSTIFEGVYKLPPGNYVRVGLRSASRHAVPRSYWSLTDVAMAGLRNPVAGDPDEFESELDELLRDAVQCRTVADVGVGVFLSGGIDSSLVTALMQSQSASRTRSFSIGFREERYDEAPFASAIAQYLGTDHTELYVDVEIARAVVPDLAAIYDEPFGDSSAIPAVILSRLTKEHVTVALSGDGGDELFGGYSRYQSAGNVWRRTRSLPGPIRRSIANVLTLESGRARSPLTVTPAWHVATAFSNSVPSRRIARIAAALRAVNPTEFYDAFTNQWPTNHTVTACGPTAGVAPEAEHLGDTDFMSLAMLRDGCVYLPDDILVKVDRASMAASLEVRVPLLDHRVVEMAWRIPPSARTRLGRGKWLLRRVLRRYVPEELTERSKKGFAVPVDDWIRGPLKQWADDLLDPTAMQRDGYLDVTGVRRAWKEHQEGKVGWRDPLWIVLMFQAWLHRDGQ